MKKHLNNLYLSLLCVAAIANMAWGQASYELDKVLAGHNGPVQNLRFSPNGKQLASCGLDDFAVAIWEVESGRLLKKLTGHSASVYEVSFSNSGQLLASASKDGTVAVWDLASGKMLGQYHNEPVKSGSGVDYKSVVFVCFSPKDDYIYFGGDNGFLCAAKIGTRPDGKSHAVERIVQVNTHDPAHIKTLTGGAITPDGKHVMVSIDNFVRVLDPLGKSVKKTFFYPYDYINDVVAGPGKNCITTWSYDGKVTIWDYKEERILQSIQVTSPKNYSAASFSPSGALMVTGAFGGSARLWDWKNEVGFATLSGHKRIVRMARFSPTEPTIATASYDGTVRLWKIKEDMPVASVEIQPEDPTPTPILPEPDKLLPRPPKRDLKPSVDGVELAVGKTIELHHIQFGQGTYKLSEEAKAELDAVFLLMKANVKMAIEIHGHTDNVGTEENNLRLSERRAMVSRHYLVSKGIAEERIAIRGFGGSRPIADNKTESTRMLNRRIEMKIMRL